MKKITLAACALAGFALIGSPAFAGSSQAQPAAAAAAASAAADQAQPAKTPPAQAQPAQAQPAQAQPAPTHSAPLVETEQARKARLEADAARTAAATERARNAKARQDLNRAQADLTRAQEHARQEATRNVARDLARVEDALRQAQRELELYAQGTSALDTARYEKALQAFAEAAALKGSKADSALYWKAFAEYKQEAMKAALESLKEIQEQFPRSRWVEQARALEMEVRHASGEALSPAATPDEELKLLALNSLVRTDAEQALPALEKMLGSQQSPRLKRRALFVVSQSRSPKAREILTAAAKNSADPALQIEALQYLQAFGGAEDKKLLSDVYSVSADKDVKLRLVEVLYSQGDAKGLVDMARKETDPAMRKRIVERLSRMKSKDATDYMLELINK